MSLGGFTGAAPPHQGKPWQVTTDHKIGLVQLEDINIPTQSFIEQQPSPTQQPLSTDSQQMSSKTAAATHAIVEETLSEPLIQYFLTVSGMDGKDINVMKATMFYTHPGVMVHNIPLPKTHQKFRIDDVLLTNWEGFDEDRHCVGAFLAWDMCAISEIEREGEEVEVEVGKGRGKERKSKEREQ